VTTFPPQTISIPEGELMNHSKDLDLSSVIQEAEFEGIINRNSTKYIELYNIPEVHSILRGSIRYKVQFLEESIHGVSICVGFQCHNA